MTTLTAEQAARRLGVSVSTLYAYVSRGLLHSEPGNGRRQRLYRAEEIEALLERRADRAQADRALAGALSWGEPLCESALTLIQDGELYYRGQNACDLARRASLEEVIALLWGDYRPEQAPSPPLVDGVPPFERFRIALPQLQRVDPRAFDLRPEGIRSSGARILHTLVALAGGQGDSPEHVDRLAQGWAPGHRRALEAALILCADHELNVSAFTARCVASAGATPYDVVTAGLAALSGHRHGGHCAKVEGLLRETQHAGAREVVLRRMKEGDELGGFSHQLYPDGDPRAACLLNLIGELPKGCQELRDNAWDLLQVYPNIDFALVALSQKLELPEGSALALFALGRTVGWLAHALEQTSGGALIRPRARYTGPSPTIKRGLRGESERLGHEL